LIPNNGEGLQGEWLRRAEWWRLEQGIKPVRIASLDRFEMGNNVLANHPPNLLFIPRTIGNELLQPLRINTKISVQISEMEEFVWRLVD
jgi:hypothetical protein